jgi:hypothetical protein
MTTKLKTLILLAAGSLILCTDVYAQVDVGADFVNRYVWRGTDFGNSPSIQPELSFAAGGLELGVWAAYATNGDPDGTEIDLWASYTIDTDAGSFSLYATDYTFPIHHTGLTGDETWFHSGAHFIELGVGYAGTEAFPVSVFAGMFVNNDDDNSVYVELGYDADPVEFFLGFTPSESAAYGTNGAGIINMGITGTRELRVTENFSLGLFASLIVNPYSETTHMLFGIRL